MKRFTAVLLLCVLAICLCACSDFGSAQNSGSGNGSAASSEVSDAGSSDSDTQIIGSENLGYMKIPKDFVRISNSESEELQYGSKPGDVIFTINSISSDIEISKALESISEKVKNDGAENVTTSTSANFNGFTANEIKCYNPKEDKFVVIYLIPFMEKTAYIAAEYTKVNENAIEYLQTWQL
jgi:hypothetical protein